MPTTKCSLLIGIDGGATKTDAVLADARGNVLARAVGGATNPSGQSWESVRARLTQTLDELLCDYGGRAARVESAFAGVAGTGLTDRTLAFSALLKEALPNARLLNNGSDAFNDMCAVLGDADGIVAIAGTGACVYARRGGVTRRVGGWGYLFNDAGSAFEIGRRALVECMRAADGLSKPSRLTDIITEALGGDIGDKLSGIYEGGRTLIASYAPCVTRAMREGCPVAAMIITDNARELARHIRAARAYLGDGAARVVLTGTVWRASQEFSRAAREALGEGYEFIISDLPPVYGALARAALEAGIKADAEFKRRFADTIKGAKYQC